MTENETPEVEVIELAEIETPSEPWTTEDKLVFAGGMVGTALLTVGLYHFTNYAYRKAVVFQAQVELKKAEMIAEMQAKLAEVEPKKAPAKKG